MSADSFTHSERDLAGRLGISRKLIGAVRGEHLHRDVDWSMVKGEVRYSDHGVEALTTALKISGEPGAPAGDSAPNTLEKIPGHEAMVKELMAAAAPQVARLEAMATVQRLVDVTGLSVGELVAVTAETLVEHLSKTPGDGDPTPAVPPRVAGAVEDLTCVKCYKPNTRILEAKTAVGEKALVRVKDNRNFLPGMVMKCRFTGTPVWELAQRLPRRRGKW